MENVHNLLSYAKEMNHPMLNKVATLFVKYSNNADVKKIAQELLPESIQVNLDEMKSLVHPEKYDFPDRDIGLIGIENVQTTDS